MYGQTSHQQWQVLQYKTIKREKREEYDDVQVIVDESRRSLKVFCKAEEIERIYCNMEVTKYPFLRMKSDHLYALMNNQSQGFRVTFRSEDREHMLSVMRKICYISETPEKNHMNRTFTNTENWGAGAVKKVSSSQPVSYSHQPYPAKLIPPPRKSAMKNLASTFKTERSYMSPQKISPVTYYSQPTRNPYSRPISSASSVSSSISSALGSLNEGSPFMSFSQNSASSYSSPQNADHRKSPYLRSQSPDNYKSPFANSQSTNHGHPSYTNLFSPESLNSSPQSAEQFLRSSPAKLTDTKSVQTDTVMMDQLIEDPQFMNTFLSRMMKSSKFGDLVRTMRAQIRNIPSDSVEDFRKKTDVVAVTDTVASSGPPAVVQMHSDLEYDVFT